MSGKGELTNIDTATAFLPTNDSDQKSQQIT
jgi:hypothetical protein